MKLTNIPEGTEQQKHAVDEHGHRAVSTPAAAAWGRRRLSSIKDVVDWGLCVGCGMCAYACSEQHITLKNVPQVGIRPVLDPVGCGACDCIKLCPGAGVDASPSGESEADGGAEHEFGRALEIWTGYATDPEIRYKGSSGGVVTALSLYCLEREAMSGVVHTGKDPADPASNMTVSSVTREELLQRTGSRYSPSSPCEALATVEKALAPAVFVGKPCDTAAVVAARKVRPELDRNLGLVLTFFCAGAPSTQGTLDLIAALGADRNAVTDIRYRGDGWPGNFTVYSGNGAPMKSLSYEESWGQLAEYRPLRCKLCPDGVGRMADIACGDAWHHDHTGANPGLSLILVRTRRGRDILRGAAAAGYVTLMPASAADVLAAQPNLLGKRRELFGRLLAFRLLAIPTPSFRGFSLFSGWWTLPRWRKFRTVAGTVRRAVVRQWWRRSGAENIQF